MLSTLRTIAIGLPNVTEGSVAGCADFRTGGRICASLDDRDGCILRLSLEAQFSFCAADPALFAEAGGIPGATRVRLDAIDEETLRSALTAAWRHVGRGALAEPGRRALPVRN